MFTGADGSATPITPVPPPKAPGLLPPLEKLLTRRPDDPMLIRSRLEAEPNEFSGYAVRAPKLVLEQPPVTVELLPATSPTRNGVALMVTSEPATLIFASP